MTVREKRLAYVNWSVHYRSDIDQWLDYTVTLLKKSVYKEMDVVIKHFVKRMWFFPLLFLFKKKILGNNKEADRSGRHRGSQMKSTNSVWSGGTSDKNFNDNKSIGLIQPHLRLKNHTLKKKHFHTPTTKHTSNTIDFTFETTVRNKSTILFI